MKRITKRMRSTIAAFALAGIGFVLPGCGGGAGDTSPQTVGNSGGGELSSQIVTGKVSAGAPFSGEVSIKDSSTASQVKTAVVGSDGTFAFDVAGMKAPFSLEATGSAGGSNLNLHSFADGPGTANVNPLSNVVVAGAAEVDDPAEVQANPNPTTLQKVRSNRRSVVSDIQTKLKSLLQIYNADREDPIDGDYDHDGLFDNVKITITKGVVTIVNAKTGAVIFTGKLSDMKNWVLPDDGSNMPPAPAVPAAPTGVAAIGGANQVTISWNSVSNASSYNIYYGTSSGVTTTGGIKISGAASPYVQSGLSAGKTYYYIVTAVNTAGESVASAQVSASTSVAPPLPAVPAVPIGVKATGGTNQATVSWSAVSGATSYNLYWSTTSGVTKTSGTKIANAVSPAVHSGLSAGTTYYYVVTAVNSAGESAASVQVAATTVAPAPTPTVPASPSGVTATGGANRVTISWSAVSGATSYNVYWSRTAGVTTVNGTKIAGATSPYVQTGLSAGTTYYYVVTAVNSAGESTASTQATATTSPAPPAVPSVPGGVSATGGANQVTISWSPSAGATSYSIYWSTSSGVTTVSGTRISGAASPYVQTGLAAGTSYYYIVTAVNSSGESAASSQVTAATTAPAPAIDGAALYTQYCSGCHGPLATSSKRGKTAAQIQAMHGSGIAASLTSAQIDAIAAALK